MSTLTFSSSLWRYTAGKGSWFFITLPREDGDFIRWIADKTVRGWGSIPVEVTIGASTWKTSIFPGKDKTYLLPIKTDVRKRERLTEGCDVRGTLSIL